MAAGLNFESIQFNVYYICIALLLMKTLLMSILTARLRFVKKSVMNKEDTKLLKGFFVRTNPEIERVRRAHLNDMENIYVFIFTSFLYTSLNPSPIIAIPLYIAYTIARFAHTYVYAIKVAKQPARFICYGVGFAITAYMAINVVLSLRDSM